MEKKVLYGSLIKPYFNLCILVFSCIITCAAVSCKETKKSVESSEITAQISDPSNAEEIAGIINKDIQDGLERAQADMGNGMPELILVESSGNNFTYKGMVTFYSGASSFERPITAIYNGKTVSYSYDDEIPSGGGAAAHALSNNTAASGNKNTRTVEVPQNLSREEFINKHFAGIEFVETDITRAATMYRRGNHNLKITGDFPRETIDLGDRGYWDNGIYIDKIDDIDFEYWENFIYVLYINDDVHLDLSEFTAFFRDIDPDYQQVSLHKIFGSVTGIILPQNYMPEQGFKYSVEFDLLRKDSSYPQLTVVFNEGIEEIPDGMFANIHRQLNIYFPKSIKRIGKAAFAGTSIPSFVVPASVIEIDVSAFENCGGLQALYFEEGSQLQKIGRQAFMLFPASLNLHDFISNELYLPDSVTVIGFYAFRGQKKLSALHISKNSKLEVIEEQAFEETQITNIYLPETIKVIEGVAFQSKYEGYAGLSSITIASPTPPRINEFSIPSDIQDIYVPSASLKLYEETWFDYQFTFNNQLKPIKE